MMNKFLFLAALCLVVGVHVPAIAQMNGALGAGPGIESGARPLMIVRFNQRSVRYQQPLYTAVSRAVETKPTVMFELVSFVPDLGNAYSNQSAASQAAGHVRDVLGTMQSIGVPQSRISVRQQAAPGLRFDEVHLFVR
jgi:hypothetical protein